MTTTVKVVAPFHVALRGVVYGPGATLDVHDNVSQHWLEHGWVTITATGSPSLETVAPNPTHHHHSGGGTGPALDEVQLISITNSPGSGNFKIGFNGVWSATNCVYHPAAGEMRT